MEILIAFILGMLVATLGIRWLARRAIEKLASALIEETQAHDQKRIKLKVEEDNQTYFVYNADTGTFICQGDNITEIRDRFQQRFPGTQAEVVGSEDLLEKLREEIKALNENSSNIRHPS